MVVIAVASLAFFISSVQKQEQNRISQLSYVQNERLDIVSIELQGNLTHWETIKVIVRNPSIYDSAVYRIAINDRYAKNWTDGIRNYSIETAPLSVPQGETKSVSVDLSDGMIGSGSFSRYDKVKVTVMSPSANFFSRLFHPPVAVAKIGVQIDRYGVGERDILILDGSESFSDSFVLGHLWRIDVPIDYLAVNWSDPTSYETRYVSGAAIRYSPEALFNITEISSLNVTGPIRVTLTVSDSYGILANSSPIIIPRNPRIVPVSHLIFGDPIHNGENTTVGVSLFDIYNRPVNGTLLHFVLADSKNATGIEASVVKTVNGQASLTIRWSGASDPGYALIEVRASGIEPEKIFVIKP